MARLIARNSLICKHARVQINHQNIVIFSKTGPDPMKITKLSSQHSMLGRHRHASETPLKWPTFSVFFYPISPHQPKKKNKSEMDPCDKTFRIRAW